MYIVDRKLDDVKSEVTLRKLSEIDKKILKVLLKPTSRGFLQCIGRKAGDSQDDSAKKEELP